MGTVKLMTEVEPEHSRSGVDASCGSSGRVVERRTVN